MAAIPGYNQSTQTIKYTYGPDGRKVENTSTEQVKVYLENKDGITTTTLAPGQSTKVNGSVIGAQYDTTTYSAGVKEAPAD